MAVKLVSLGKLKSSKLVLPKTFSSCALDSKPLTLVFWNTDTWNNIQLFKILSSSDANMIIRNRIDELTKNNENDTILYEYNYMVTDEGIIYGIQINYGKKHKEIIN